MDNFFRRRVGALGLTGALLVICSGALGAGEKEKPPFVYGLRPLGMGDAFTAVAEGFDTLYYNPAGLAFLKDGEVYLLHLSAVIDTKSIGDIQYLMEQNDAGNLDPANITQDVVNKIVRTRLAAGADLFRSGYIRKNQGFAAYIPLEMRVAFKPGLIIPDAELYVNYDVISSYSYAHGIKTGLGELGVGGSLRLIRRTRWYEQKSVLELASDFSSLDQQEIVDKLTAAYWGVSTDVGFLLKRGEKTRWALVMNDFLCRLHGDWKRPNVKIGYARRFDITTGWIWEGLLVAVDWVDIIGDDERVPLWRKKFSTHAIQDSLPIFAKRLRFGVESKFMKTLKVRCGLLDGYPTVGVGLDASFFHLGYALYGREFGVYPGDDGRYFHQAEMVIAW